MTSSVPAETDPAERGLLAALFAAVRTEWRQDIVVAPDDNPIFNYGGCRVAGCHAPAHTRKRLCRAHNLRWTAAGRPEMQQWLTTQHGPTTGRAPLATCLVPRCEFGRNQEAFCGRHFYRWRQAGAPPKQAWTSSFDHDPAEFAHFPRCLVDGCELLTTADPQLCESHRTRWRQHLKAGHPHDLDAYLRRVAIYGKDSVDVSGLPPQLRLEIQYGLQCRADERRLKTRLLELRPAVRFLARSGVSSLTEWSPEQWRDACKHVRGLGQKSPAHRFVHYCRERVDIVEHGAGWDAEYPRGVWRMSRLGYHSAYEHLRFTRVPQPWLRDLAKRWLRHRLSVGLAYQIVYLSLVSVVSLARYLNDCPAPPHSAGELTRAQLEGWLAHLSTTDDNPANRLSLVTGIRVFLQEVHRREWAPDLPATCMLYPEDTPKLGKAEPRALPEFVMRQLETTEQLDLYPNPSMRLITEVMITCGLRGKDARRLEFDCMVRDGRSHPYLTNGAPPMRADNTEHIVAAAKRRSADSLQRVRDTLRELQRAGKPVTIAGVARQAKVSRTFLHSQPELLRAIQSLQAPNDGPNRIPARQRASEKSLLTRIEALTLANKKLRAETQRFAVVSRQRSANCGICSRTGRHAPSDRRDWQALPCSQSGDGR